MDNICCFIGHRKIDLTKQLEEKTKKVIEDLIVNKNVATFLFGSKSEFDSLCHRLVSNLKEKYPHIKRIAYTCRSESCILESEKQKWEEIYSKFFKQKVKLFCYDEEFEHRTKYTSGRASYVERNMAMIDRSNYCVFYYDESYKPPAKKEIKHGERFCQQMSGTAIAYKYASRKKKYIINIFLL